MSETFSLLNRMKEEGFEDVVFMSDPATGLLGVIAIHDTTLGPGFGGTRIMPYKSESDAINDALRLSKAMTYKNAACGIDFGGGKAVLIGDPKKVKTEAYLRSFARHINGLGGRYITGVDIGTDSNDMIVLLKETKYVVALPESYGGCGDTTAATAFGLYNGLKTAAKMVFGDDDLGKRTIAVQGTGHIGTFLTRRLAQDGAKLYITDINKEWALTLAKETGATFVEPDDIFSVPCDILSPNALGGIMNDQVIPQLKCKVVAGAANNQLLNEEKHSRMLMDRGIIFVPDFILSAGGVINNSFQFTGYNKEKAYGEIEKRISSNVERIISDSLRTGVSPHVAALQLAEDRIRAAHGLKKYYLRT